MNGEMSGKERILNAIRRQPVDYVPCSPMYNRLTEVQRAKYKYQFPWGAEQKDMIAYNVEVLGVDPVVSVSIDPPAAHIPTKTWMDDGILHKVYETPSGPLQAAITYNELWPFGDNIPLHTDFVSHFTEPWIKAENDIEKLRHIISPPQSAEWLTLNKTRFEHAKQLADRYQLAISTSIGTGLTGALQLFGAEALCLAVIDQPDLVDAYLELEHQNNLRLMQIAIDLGIDIIIRNGFYETADFYGPATLEKFLKSRLQAEIDLVHQGEKVVAYTLNTGVMPILDYVADLDFDCVHKLEISPKCIDLEQAHAKLGASKSFWTGPSNTYHMWSEDTNVVRDAVREAFSVLGPVGLIISASPTAHCIMPWENTLAMIDEWKRLR